MKLSSLNGIGESKLEALAKVNIYKINDLISYFPNRYEDRTKLYQFKDFLSLDENNSKIKLPILAEVIEHKYVYFANNKQILKIILYDGTLTANLICYNREFLKDIIKIGQQFIIIANFQYKYDELQTSNFEYIQYDNETLSALRIVPIYPLTEGLTQNIMRKAIYQALNSIHITETLPEYLIQKHKLISKNQTFNQIHFPSNQQQLEKAIYRMKYYELFELECNVALKKYYFNKHKKEIYKKRKLNLNTKLINSLNFKLTNDQIRTLKDIKKDLYSPFPMHRMLQGDVGCGKTIVAIISMLIPIENNKQAAFMAPTEILAKQHYHNIKKLTKSININITLLTANLKIKEKKEILNNIKEGKSNIIIGTQALFSKDIIYKNLALVVIDEQHKFGVFERAKLVNKGNCVDILLMTATPIPRSLSLTVYGELELSVIKEKPKRNAQTKSYFIFSENKKQKMYNFINEEIQNERQGFVVCPSIEDSDKIDISSALSTFNDIKNKYLPQRQSAIIHSKLTNQQKEETMYKFQNRKYDILIATTVIEVGIDIPNASFIVIEDANRFGLSQLHQLRGRIGRGQHNSHCFFVVKDKLSNDAKKRLQALLEHNNGFILAEEDLKIRGTGQFLGTKQSGINSLKFANLIEDHNILDKAREDAFELVLNDPKFQKKEHNTLKNIYKDFIKNNRTLLAN